MLDYVACRFAAMYLSSIFLIIMQSVYLPTTDIATECAGTDTSTVVEMEEDDAQTYRIIFYSWATVHNNCKC